MWRVLALLTVIQLSWASELSPSSREDCQPVDTSVTFSKKVKGCKDVEGKLYKVNKFIKACCYKFTCKKKGKKAFQWSRTADAAQCCNHEGGLYQMGETIGVDNIDGACTAVELKCAQDEAGRPSVEKHSHHNFCCSYEDKVIPVGSSIPMPENCASLQCQQGAWGPTYSIVRSFASCGCCWMSGMMVEDGSSVWVDGVEAKCCNGTIMAPVDLPPTTVGPIITPIISNVTFTSMPGDCQVVDGPALGESCIFPFTWNYTGLTYSSCVFEEGDSWPWCSTNVDTTGTHITGGGHWGKCDPDTCPMPTSSTPFTNGTSPPPPPPSTSAGTTGTTGTTGTPGECKVVEDSPTQGAGKACIFPFTWGYNGVTYDGCAFVPEVDTFPWCSTLVDADGNHVAGAGEWGECDMDVCPLATGVTTTTTGPTTTTLPVQPGTEGSCACGLAQRNSRIVGGEQTEVNEYPWLVGLGFYGSSTPSCGGSLINDRWVLTAAHCTQGKQASSISVILGEHNTQELHETNMIKRTVIKIVDHPNYNGGNTDYDFSLLKISGFIDFGSIGTELNTHIRPVCLPLQANIGSTPDHVGEKAIVAGWGTTSAGGDLSDYAQEVEVEIFSESKCKSSYGSSITDRMVCAGHDVNGKDSCQGDSGGPLVYSTGSGTTYGENYEVTGVVSWGYGCAQAAFPGVYARVSYVLNWITENANDGLWCPRIPTSTLPVGK